MRVTISHSRQPDEVKQLVDRSLDDVFSSIAKGMVRVVDQQKTWSGDTMSFAMNLKVGPLNAPVRGFVAVTDHDVTIDADLGLLEKFAAQDGTKAAIESKVKGLLA